jgi:hypothetical protein
MGFACRELRIHTFRKWKDESEASVISKIGIGRKSCGVASSLRLPIAVAQGQDFPDLGDFPVTEPALGKVFELYHQTRRHFPFALSTDQQPRQIDLIILSTFASSRSTTGLVPPSGPF